MLHHYILFFFSVMNIAVSAQHYADKWYFGNGEGLDFTGTCDPVVLSDGAINGFEGCSTISDPLTGELLLYTNSEKIWGRDHQVLPNGIIQPSDADFQNTITQVIIIPEPSDPLQYNVITNQIQGGHFGGFGMRLARVDLSLNDGIGDVIFKDSIIYADTVSEKVIAIPHDNGNDIWVIGHAVTGNAFFSVLFTAGGIQYPAVISSVGKSYASSEMDYIGEMKASPNGQKIAVTTVEAPDIELFDFDRTTGQITGPIVIEATGQSWASWWYGVSFSPDNTKLYVGGQNFGNNTESLFQVDISSNDEASINSTKVTVSTASDIYSLQLSPNGRIYLRRQGLYLGEIANPNVSGLTCGFDPQAVYFGQVPGSMGHWGLNNFIALTEYPCLEIGHSINDVSQVASIVHPNPTTGIINFSDQVAYKIFDATGQLIRSGNGTQEDLSGEHAGLYIIRAWISPDRYEVHRVIVEK